jgi:hypothetical protein
MADAVIDVWDVRTFDAELIAALEGNADLIRDYLKMDREIFLSHDLGRGPRSMLRPDNPHAANFLRLQEAIGREMQKRAIRAFHYTRLTDEEVGSLKRNGIHLSTPVSLKRRLNDLVRAGSLTHDIAKALYAQSPFHSDQLKSRSDKFWMVSHPIAVDDGGVVPLMKHWGGEVASMWVEDETLTSPLALIGKPRVIEVSVPMSATRHSYNAGKAVVATFARSRGSIPEKHAFDVYTFQDLPPRAILGRPHGRRCFVLGLGTELSNGLHRRRYWALERTHGRGRLTPCAPCRVRRERQCAANRSRGVVAILIERLVDDACWMPPLPSGEVASILRAGEGLRSNVRP